MSGNLSSPVQAAPSPVGGQQRPRWRRWLLYGGGVLVTGAFFWLTSTPPQPPKEAARPATPDAPGTVGAPFDPYRPAVQRAALPVPPPSQEPSLTGQMLAPQRAYRPAPLMAFGEQRGAVGEPGTGQHPAGGPGAAEPDPLARRLHVEEQPTAVATRLPDRNLFLTEGTPLPCVPDAPITSDVEGAFRCKVPEAVYATSGAVPLLDAGTWITGRVGAGLRRGQRRLFAVMTRVETPQGCIIRIRAPAADALGQAGLDGEIDNHFFQRFGAYIGMAFLDAGMQAAVLAASSGLSRNRSGINFYQFQNAGRQGGRDLFAEDAAIPPTLYRNQAEPIVVRLTQDIDMRPCFRLRPREAVR